MSSTRSSPDSTRLGTGVAPYERFLDKSDHDEVAAQVRLVFAAPGPALLVWGEDAIVLAYNRAYRAFAAYRVSALERPLFKAQPEIERAWRPRLEQALSGVAAILDPADCAPDLTHEPAARSMSGPPSSGSAKSSGVGEVRSGWILPIGVSPGQVKGALILLMDVTPVVDPLRRAVALVAVELRESLIGVRVLSERLTRASKVTPERFMGDVGRILEMTTGMERTADDMTTFARFAGGTGVQVNPRPGDLGALVRAACEELVAQSELASPRPMAGAGASMFPSAEGASRSRLAADLDGAPPSRSSAYLDSATRGSASLHPPSLGTFAAPVTPRTTSSTWLRVNVVAIPGSWDPDAIHRVVVNLITAARRYGTEGGEVSVEVMSGREGAVLVVRAEGRPPREDDLEALYEPWKRAIPPGDRRRLGSGLGLFIARELIMAHGGRLSWESAGPTTFALRAVLPPASPARPPPSTPSMPPPRRF
jgi:signal transduction histidine kinase